MLKNIKANFLKNGQKEKKKVLKKKIKTKSTQENLLNLISSLKLIICEILNQVQSRSLIPNRFNFKDKIVKNISI